MSVQLTHTIVVTLLAASAGVFGLGYLTDGFQEVGARDIGWVAGASVVIWLTFGNVYLHTDRGWLCALYFGFLSPFIGCCILLPPFSFFVVFSKPVFSVLLGVCTSLAVFSASRSLADA